MAMGSGSGGRVADRVRSPLRLYGAIELLLVVVVLLTPVTFRLLHEVYRGVYGALQDAPTMLAFLRFGLSVLALGRATVLLGATLPVLSRQLARGHLDLSPQFGRLYAANTLGAILGTEVAGFILIELLGLTGTLVVGALCSATAGAIALLLSSRRLQSQPRAWGGPAREPQTMAGGAIGEHATTVDRGADQHQADCAAPSAGLALTVAFVSGLTSLGYQVLWTRLLASGSGNTTYVFTTILTFFLA